LQVIIGGFFFTLFSTCASVLWVRSLSGVDDNTRSLSGVDDSNTSSNNANQSVSTRQQLLQENQPSHSHWD
jgi:hypothetical protein